MKREELLNKLKNMRTRAPYEELVEAQDAILNYLELHPQDTEMWIRLAILENTPPLEDFELIVSYMKNVLKYDPHNALAILILFYFSKFFSEITDEHLKLLESAQTDDPKIKGILEIAKAQYSDYKDEKNWTEYEKHLRKSIEHDPHQVRSFFTLGLHAVEQRNYDEAERFLETGLKNVRRAFGSEGKKTATNDYSDYNDFFDEFFRKTIINRDYVEYIKSIVKQLNEKSYPIKL